jgi:hypothetical protein
MLDHSEYTTGLQGYQGNGDGYDHLQGDWALFYKVAKGFTHRVRPDDRQDFLHDLLLTMAKVKVKYEAIGKLLTEAGLIRVACYDVAEYWRKNFRRINGTDCGRCSQEQRRKCKEKDSYRECAKAIKLDSLDRLIDDGNGNQVELSQMIADDNAVDLVARLDARLTLQSYPHRFVKIAYKKYAGYPLNNAERQHYYSQLTKIRKRLVTA